MKNHEAKLTLVAGVEEKDMDRFLWAANSFMKGLQGNVDGDNDVITDNLSYKIEFTKFHERVGLGAED